MRQTRTPLYSGLKAYSSRRPIGFHTPGHTGGRPFALRRLIDLDLTEIPHVEIGQAPPDLVLEAERLAAQLFGAGRTFFLSNGASLGVMAMLLGSCPPGTEVYIERYCHRSVVNACIIGDLRPRFLTARQDTNWGFPLGVDTAELGAALSGGLPVLITNPTYHGAWRDLRPLAGISGNLLVDEAHGSHLAAVRRPWGAAAANARAWVHGTHKTLGSLTQTGLMHLAPGVDDAPYLTWLERLGTTSPSYPLLASLDLARHWAAGQGEAAWKKAAERLAILRRELAGAGYKVMDQSNLPVGIGVDPAKLTMAAPGGGAALAGYLWEKHRIQTEAVGLDWINLLVMPFHRRREISRLRAALLAYKQPAAIGDSPPQ